MSVSGEGAGSLALPAEAPDDPGFVAVDRFMVHEIEARALSYALERGLIDRLAAGPQTPLGIEGMAPKRLEVLLAILAAGGVVERRGDTAALTGAFRAILPFRDLLESKLAFAERASADLRELFPAFIENLPDFMGRSRTFELFRYDRCLEITPDNVAATRRWVGYTTCLTRYEAGPCLDRVDLGRHRRLLDLGGNSGEFVAQACRRAPHLDATVFDLPVVCALGRENLAGRPERTRVRFHAGDMRRDRLPAGHDLVVFKSVLHDWPEADAERMIGRAVAALEPGGRLLVYERSALTLEQGRADYAAAANLVFQPFFRSPDFYVAVLRRLGLVATVGTIELETPFMLLLATKPEGGA